MQHRLYFFFVYFCTAGNVCVNLPILDCQTKCHSNPRRVLRLTCFQEQVGWEPDYANCKSKFLPHPSFSFMLETSIHDCFFSFLYLSILSTLQIPEHISERHDGHNVSDPTDLAFRFSIKSISYLLLDSVLSISQLLGRMMSHPSF